MKSTEDTHPDVVVAKQSPAHQREREGDCGRHDEYDQPFRTGRTSPDEDRSEGDGPTPRSSDTPDLEPQPHQRGLTLKKGKDAQGGNTEIRPR